MPTPFGAELSQHHAGFSVLKPSLSVFDQIFDDFILIWTNEDDVTTSFKYDNSDFIQYTHFPPFLWVVCTALFALSLRFAFAGKLSKLFP